MRTAVSAIKLSVMPRTNRTSLRSRSGVTLERLQTTEVTLITFPSQTSLLATFVLLA